MLPTLNLTIFQAVSLFFQYSFLTISKNGEKIQFEIIEIIEIMFGKNKTFSISV